MNHEDESNGCDGLGCDRVCAMAATDAADDAVVGNFLLGEWFGAVRCRHGHETRLFNIGRGHFVACDRCHTYLFVGSNLMSGWRQENEDIWRKNRRSVKGYRFLE